MPACLWGPRIPRQPRPQASPLSHRYYLLQNRMRKSRKAQGGPAAPSRFSPDTLSRTTTLPAGAHLPSLPSIGLGSVATGQPGRDQSASSAQRPGLTGNLVSPAANSGTGRSLALRNPHGRKWRRTKEPLDETERGEQKSWLKTQHSKDEDHGIQSHHFIWQIDGETMGTVTDFFFLGSKITADGDCSPEIQRHLLLGRKGMTNLASILKSRDITLPAKVHLVKAMVFPVVRYRCDSWIIKKAELLRIDAFELWC